MALCGVACATGAGNGAAPFLCYNRAGGSAVNDTEEGNQDRSSELEIDSRILIFKTCVAALWADGKMMAAERDHLSHLINKIATSETERSELRRMAMLQDVNRHELVAGINGLDDADRRDLFDRCVALLSSDRRLARREVRFLAQIRKSCGIGFWSFRRLVWRATWRRRVVFAVLLIGAIAVVGYMGLLRRQEPGFPPTEARFFQDVAMVAASPDRAALDSAELYELVRSSVVTVNVMLDGAEQGNGSGAVIGWDDAGQLYILTNRHVIYHEVPAGHELCFEAELEGGIQLPAMLDFYSRRHDLALLVVPGLTGWAEPLAIQPRQQLRVGQKVYAVGSPMGLDHTFTTGVISALRSDSIQTDATVYFGSSGGPLVDESGALCGVITSTHSHKDISFAIYADAILDMFIERREAKTAAQVGGN